MPDFEIVGKCKDTGRKRQRIYTAENESEARSKAEADGTIIESIRELPPEPATERQLSYAKDLGISIPSNPTKNEMIYLISKAVDPPASKTQMYCLNEHGIQLDKYTFESIEKVVATLDKELQQVNRELARWYMYSVIRYLTKGNWNTPDKSGVSKEQSYVMADKIIAQADVLKSLLRELEFPDRRYNLVSFSSEQLGGELSIRTKAFNSARAIVTEELGIQSQTREKPQRSASPPKGKKTGCFSILLIIAFVLMIMATIFK
jgi:hypothetical protein